MRRSGDERCVGMAGGGGGGERVAHERLSGRCHVVVIVGCRLVVRVWSVLGVSRGRGATRALRRHVAVARCRACSLVGGAPVAAAATAVVVVVVAVCGCAVVSHAVSAAVGVVGTATVATWPATRAT